MVRERGRAFGKDGRGVQERGPGVHERGPGVRKKRPEVHERGPEVPERCPRAPERCPRAPERCPGLQETCPGSPENCPCAVERCPVCHEGGRVAQKNGPVCHDDGGVTHEACPVVHQTGRRSPKRGPSPSAGAPVWFSYGRGLPENRPSLAEKAPASGQSLTKHAQDGARLPQRGVRTRGSPMAGRCAARVTATTSSRRTRASATPCATRDEGRPKGGDTRRGSASPQPRHLNLGSPAVRRRRRFADVTPVTPRHPNPRHVVGSASGNGSPPQQFLYHGAQSLRQLAMDLAVGSAGASPLRGRWSLPREALLHSRSPALDLAVGSAGGSAPYAVDGRYPMKRYFR
jgi:hypothetical protein